MGRAIAKHYEMLRRLGENPGRLINAAMVINEILDSLAKARKLRLMAVL